MIVGITAASTARISAMTLCSLVSASSLLRRRSATLAAVCVASGADAGKGGATTGVETFEVSPVDDAVRVGGSIAMFEEAFEVDEGVICVESPLAAVDVVPAVDEPVIPVAFGEGETEVADDELPFGRGSEGGRGGRGEESRGVGSRDAIDDVVELACPGCVEKGGLGARGGVG